MGDEVNSVVRDVRNAQRQRLGLPEVEHDGRDDIDAFIQAGGTIPDLHYPDARTCWFCADPTLRCADLHKRAQS